MSVQFKYFVTEQFKKILEEKLKTNLSQNENLILYRFKKKYDAEVLVFNDRRENILKEFRDLVDEVIGKNFDEKTFEEKLKILEEKEESKLVLKSLIENQNKKFQELLDCTSELKKLEYDLISKTNPNAEELGILEGIMDNIPLE